MWGLVTRILLFDFLACLAVAKLEINIEGKNGWAKHLPTIRYQNRLTKIIWGNSQSITGYHIWLGISVLIFIHLPFFIFPAVWSIPTEALTLASFFFAVILEDFFWFMLNPAFGIRKFNKENITWFGNWLGSIPYFYIGSLLMSLVLFLVFVVFNTQDF